MELARHPTPDVPAPSPETWAPQRHWFRSSLSQLDAVRQTLNFEDDEDEEEDVITIEDDEDEEDEVISIADSDVDSDEEDYLTEVNGAQDVKLPVGPVLMAMKALASLINPMVIEGCQGCIEDQPGQDAHPDCLTMTWEDKLDRYFKKALKRLEEKDFMRFFNAVYLQERMYEDEIDMAAAEAVEFFHCHLRDSRVRWNIKAKMLKM